MSSLNDKKKVPGLELTGREPVIMFDLDGTLYQGNRVYQFFARALVQGMPARIRASYWATVSLWLRGQYGVKADNWQAVVKLALPYVCNEGQWRDAFEATRRYMREDPEAAPVPGQLWEFLEFWRDRGRLVVVSNSPTEAAQDFLRTKGLAPWFHRLEAEARKPEEWGTLTERVADRLQVRYPLFVSVGDHYANDIKPAYDRGWITVHVSPRGYFPGPSTLVGRRLSDVLPKLTVILKDSLGIV